MKPKYLIIYFNSFLSFQDDYLFLRVINKTETNEIHCVWWHEDDCKHEGTVGQWKLKTNI